MIHPFTTLSGFLLPLVALLEVGDHPGRGGGGGGRLLPRGRLGRSVFSVSLLGAAVHCGGGGALLVGRRLRETVSVAAALPVQDVLQDVLYNLGRPIVR